MGRGSADPMPIAGIVHTGPDRSAPLSREERDGLLRNLKQGQLVTVRWRSRGVTGPIEQWKGHAHHDAFQNDDGSGWGALVSFRVSECPGCLSVLDPSVRENLAAQPGDADLAVFQIWVPNANVDYFGILLGAIVATNATLRQQSMAICDQQDAATLRMAQAAVGGNGDNGGGDNGGNGGGGNVVRFNALPPAYQITQVHNAPTRAIIAQSLNGHVHTASMLGPDVNLYDARTLFRPVSENAAQFKMALAYDLRFNNARATPVARVLWNQLDLQINFLARFVNPTEPPDELITSINHLVTAIRIECSDDPQGARRRLALIQTPLDPLAAILCPQRDGAKEQRDGGGSGGDGGGGGRPRSRGRSASARRGARKFCNYCHMAGHEVERCFKRQRDMQERSFASPAPQPPAGFRQGGTSSNTRGH